MVTHCESSYPLLEFNINYIQGRVTSNLSIPLVSSLSDSNKQNYRIWVRKTQVAD